MSKKRKTVKRTVLKKPKLFAQNIPAEIRQVPRWTLYKIVVRKTGNGQAKTTKPPISPHDGKAGSPTDPSKWSSFNKALMVHDFGRYDTAGLGFNLTKDDDYIAVDIDDCIRRDGRPAKRAREIIGKFDSYTEKSPSGKGIRIIARGTMPEDGRKNSKKKVEIYQNRRYVTVTGDVLDGRGEIRKCQKAIDWLFAEYFPSPKTSDKGNEAVSAPASSALRLGFGFGIARVLSESEVIDRILSKPYSARLYNGDISGFPSKSEPDISLCRHLAFWTRKNPELIDKIFRTSKLFRPKWDSPRGATTYGAMTIENAVRHQTKIYGEKYEQRRK